MNKTDAKRLELVERSFDKYEDDYRLTPEDIEWLISQAKRVQEIEKALKAFESVMDQEMEWHNTKIKVDKNRTFNVGAYSGWKDVKRHWRHTRQVLKGGKPEWKS